LRRITKAFYDKIYEHPWLGKYFETIDRDHIASQQAEFMQGVLGGPQIYRGRTPGTAHPHIEIAEKAIDLRQELLRQPLAELRVRKDIAEHWLKLDEAFRQRLIKDKGACSKRYGTDKLIVAPPSSR
ncbi:MAG: group 1 truncated hemoglobin, partial [Myxococcales bacterium]|nr:group 1 truncated hemoglobin [Myxococcales bacterium]